MNEPGKPKILIFCPTYRLEPETVDAIMAQRHDFLLDVTFTRWNPGGDDRNAILWQYSKARRTVLTCGYDALFIIESDVIPPADALQKLLKVDADIASGLYVFRRQEQAVVNACRYIPGHDWPEQSYSFFPDDFERLFGKTIRTSGLGIGCTLIHRHVLEGIAFRDGGVAHCDYTLARDALVAGYSMKVDTSILCGHKRPDGVILYPTSRGEATTVPGVDDQTFHLPEAKKALDAGTIA